MSDLERILVLAPLGRDGAVAAGIVREAGMQAEICRDLPTLIEELGHNAGCAFLSLEAVRATPLHPLLAWINQQPPWSDLPLIVVTERGGGTERSPGALRLIETLGNVTLLERPFHPATMVSVVRSALRSRRRQYQARAQLDELVSRETAIQESEGRFRTLAENIPVLAWTAHPDGGIFWYNPRWYAYTGTTPEEMRGWGWQSVHDPEILPEVMRRWAAAVASGEPFEMVFPIRGADGVLRPFLTRVAPVRGPDNKVVRWFGTNVDISTERAAEASVRASEESLRFALAAGSLGSWELDHASRSLTSSAIFKASFGRSSDAAFAYDDLIASIHQGDRDRVEASIAELAREGGDYAAEYRVIWPDQSVHWVEMRGRSIGNPAGLWRMAGVSLDITARKRSELELRLHREQLEEHVAARTVELAQALEQVQAEIVERERAEDALRQSQKMEAIGQLTGGIAHDFNNLLTGIAGSIELMQTRLQQGRAGEIGRYISAAGESVSRAASLTHRLLAFARRQTLELKQVNANQLVAGMEELVRRTVGPAIRIEIVLAGGLWPTVCDVNQLESAILNLCINARDAMQDGGTLTIETGNTHLDDAYVQTQRDVRAGQYVAISVSDTGTGMSPETVGRAFDPFFTTKPIGQGTGLGLSMVYGFIKQSEGHVRIYSEAGRGTSVRMYLPRQTAAGAEADDADPEPATPPAATKSGKTVLVVEDEAVIRALIVEALGDLGYQTLEAIDGPSGLRIMQSSQLLELLVTDVGLPGMNGRQLADAARQLRPELKVLFITGYAHNAAVGNHLLDVGMHMVTKPFALNALTEKVRALIDA